DADHVSRRIDQDAIGAVLRTRAQPRVHADLRAADLETDPGTFVGDALAQRDVDDLDLVDEIDALHLLQPLVHLRQIQRAPERPSLALRSAALHRAAELLERPERLLASPGAQLVARVFTHVDSGREPDPQEERLDHVQTGGDQLSRLQ